MRSRFFHDDTAASSSAAASSDAVVIMTDTLDLSCPILPSTDPRIVEAAYQASQRNLPSLRKELSPIQKTLESSLLSLNGLTVQQAHLQEQMRSDPAIKDQLIHEESQLSEELTAFNNDMKNDIKREAFLTTHPSTTLKKHRSTLNDKINRIRTQLDQIAERPQDQIKLDEQIRAKQEEIQALRNKIGELNEKIERISLHKQNYDDYNNQRKRVRTLLSGYEYQFPHAIPFFSKIYSENNRKVIIQSTLQKIHVSTNNHAERESYYRAHSSIAYFCYQDMLSGFHLPEVLNFYITLLDGYPVMPTFSVGSPTQVQTYLNEKLAGRVGLLNFHHPLYYAIFLGDNAIFDQVYDCFVRKNLFNPSAPAVSGLTVDEAQSSASQKTALHYAFALRNEYAATKILTQLCISDLTTEEKATLILESLATDVPELVKFDAWSLAEHKYHQKQNVLNIVLSLNDLGILELLVAKTKASLDGMTKLQKQYNSNSMQALNKIFTHRLEELRPESENAAVSTPKTMSY